MQARHTPIGIAARAIARSGKGHKYWSKFKAENIEMLEQLSKEVNTLLFQPKLPHGPVKTLDLPVAGEAYAAQSLPLILEFIQLVNGSASNGMDETDSDGTKTITCLNRCKKLAENIDSNSPGSLGLHPAVYFYAPNGRHKVASFLAVVALLLDFSKTDYRQFTKIRGQFETLLIQYDYLIQQIVRLRRGAAASVHRIRDFYRACIKALNDGESIEQTIEGIVKSQRFGKLVTENDEPPTGQDFSRGTKSQVFLREALKTALKCKICDGFLHVNAISVDHITRKQDGGQADSDNAQLTHPYCNTGYKERLNTKR